MFEAIAIVIAAFISVGGIVLTQWFNYRQRKTGSKERFFYEIYQRRLALYDDVNKTLAVMGRPEEELLHMSLKEFNNKVIGDSHTLLTLINRLSIYGSPDARGILNAPMVKMRDILQKNLIVQFANFSGGETVSDAINSMAFAEAVNSFVLIVNESLTKFAECVGKETGADFIDKEIVEFLGEVPVIKKTAKPKKRNSREPDKGIGK